MSDKLEKLGIEQLRAWRERMPGAPENPYDAAELVDELLALRARVAKLEAALKRSSHHFATVGKLHSLDMRGPLHEIDAALSSEVKTK